MRILVAEDDAVLAEGVIHTLRQSGHAVDRVNNGAEADSALAANQFDLLILDLGLPKRSGLDVLKRLRASDARLPVLILTALDGVRDRVRGLDAGADDYLVKPFDVGELNARVRALLRRTNAEIAGDRLSFGELELDADRHGVRFGDKVADLTRTEYQLLELLMLNPRRVLPHSLIYERVWGYDFGPSSNALRVYIGYLRRKLADLGAPDLIQNVRGVGYALRDPDS